MKQTLLSIVVVVLSHALVPHKQTYCSRDRLGIQVHTQHSYHNCYLIFCELD